MKWVPFGFQNMLSSSYWVDWLHDYILVFLVGVLILVGGFLVSLSRNKSLSLKLSEVWILEFLWTFFPGIVLVSVGVPSLFVLYSDEKTEEMFSLKINGHQWYWSYDYSDFEGVEYDSYLKPVEELKTGSPRILENDNRVVFPLESTFRLMISSEDVLHSWAVPGLSLKSDANPGRMNFLTTPSFFSSGLFYGQCSEICGANHSFMPISVEVVPFNLFSEWASSFKL